jgi:class 3 adenylate cyclase
VAQVLDRALCPVLVGRAAQLEALEDALLAADRGEGQVVILAGEAGMGKTRLAEELQSAARRAGTVVMEGSCSEAELALPYLPFLEAIGNYLAIADLDALRERLGPFRRELAQLFPQMDPEASHGDGGDPTQGRLRLFEALIALLRIPADEHGVLLIVEDIHWADASTRELLDYMTRRLRTTRIMVLATYRSDELHRRHPLLPLVQGWRRSGTARIVELEHLGPDGIADMVRAIFDTDEVSDEFRDFLYERSEGNPFVAEELLKASIDRGDIYRTDGGWERRELRELTLPRTVTDSVLLRLERLSDEEAEILHAAAILGRSFDYRTLAAVAGPSEDRVQEGLHLFVQQQLMEEETDTHRYRFRHALTREAIYTDLITPRRLALHSRAADALSKIEGTPPVDLAYHLLAAARDDEAIPIVMEAAQDAVQRRGFREAAQLYERIVRIVTSEPDRSRLHCLLAEAYYFSAEAPRAIPLYEQAIPVVEAQGEIVFAAHHRLWLGRSYWETSKPELARREYERVRDALEPLGPSGDLAQAYTRLAGMELFALRPRESLVLAQRASKIAEAAGSDWARLWADVFVGSAELGIDVGIGAPEAGLATLERVRLEAEAKELGWIAGNALFNELETRSQMYGPAQALERLALLPDQTGRPGGPPVDYIEGLAYLYLGEPERARTSLETAGLLADQAGFSTFSAWVGREVALAYSMLGRHAEAVARLPGREGRQERQDAVPATTSAMRVLLDAGDESGAAGEADIAITLFNVPCAWIPMERRLADQLHETLVTIGREADAASIAALVANAGIDPMDPYVNKIAGRAALAGGDSVTAAERLASAADTFRRVGYRDEEWRTRRLLATALDRSDRPDEAIRELRSVLAAAQEHGHVAEAAKARARLDALEAAGPPAGTAVASPPRRKTPAGRSEGVRSGRAKALPGRRPARMKARAGGGGDEVPQAQRAVAAEPAPSGGPGSGLGHTRPTEVVATVMFLDVRGYTEQTARRAPQDTVERLSSLHRWAKREVERHHGTVDKFAGDAVMAVFNASGARLDHAVHALEAALAIRDKAAYAGMPVGIGLATGPAVVGRLAEGANLSAVGETTNLAARLQTAAGPGEIVLSGETHRRVRDWLARRSVEARVFETELKGFEVPVTAYRLART